MVWGSRRKKGDELISSSLSSPNSNSSQEKKLSNKPKLSYAQPYKGLSSSITHIFTSSSNARIDCCALSCCGILQSDYNRYIILGRRAPTFKYRCLVHVLVPIIIFCTAGYCAVRIQNPMIAEIVCTALLFCCVAWVVLSCWRSTMKRSMARQELLRKVKGVSSGLVVESMDSQDEEVLLGQSSCEIRCAHRMIGCYPSDLPSAEEPWSEEQMSLQGKDDGTNFLSKLSRCFSSLFFGACCQYHLQFCGICALAQEGREIDSLVPRERRQIDYITFQAYMAYYNPIRVLRREKNGWLFHHYKALSKLSRMILKSLLSVTLIMILIATVFESKLFQLGNFIVFVATFLQAFLVLYVVHWYWNRFDISLDAVIKYFAFGFLITISTVLVFEVLETVVLGALLQFVMKLMQQGEENQDVYESTLYLLDYNPMRNSHDSVSWWWNYEDFQSAAANNAKRIFQQQHPLLTTFFLFLQAYFVAALVEETAKYFGFKSVEHPDFLSEQELKMAAKEGIFNLDDEDDDEYDYEHWYDCGGGERGYDSEESDDEEFNQPKSKSPFLEDPNSSKWKGIRKNDVSESAGISAGNTTRTTKQEVTLEPCPPRSCNSVGAAITIAMVSVALGYACCENLIYIFIYSGNSLSSEIGVLIARSLFPVHPLCAAIQSIGVCRQQLENDKSINLGRIIFPALLLHGTYDFSLMTLNFYGGLSQNGDEAENQLQMILYALMALFFSVFIVLSGALYYVKESRAQKIRLEQVDNARSFLGVYS